jgi:ABC-type antimicrobial peptide transport system permease subunit
MPGFFGTLGLPILAGRDFEPSDKHESQRVMMINRSLAEALFADRSPIGRVVELPSRSGSQFFQVIGVVADSHYYDPRRKQPAAFFTFQTNPPYMPTLHVRVASADALAYLPAVRREFNALDKGFPIFNARTLKDRIDDALSRERMIADLSTAFGVLALVLAAVGLYGVFTYSVTQRTREIGLRMALGSKISDVLWLVMREALLTVGVGSGIGMAAGAVGTSMLSSQLYGVAPADPLTLFVSTTAIIVIAMLAVSLPALKASRIDPMIALRHD